jgi:hypothetical protein
VGCITAVLCEETGQLAAWTWWFIQHLLCRLLQYLAWWCHFQSLSSVVHFNFSSREPDTSFTMSFFRLSLFGLSECFCHTLVDLSLPYSIRHLHLYNCIFVPLCSCWFLSHASWP